MTGEPSDASAAPAADPLAVTAAALGAVLGVPVRTKGVAPPTFRFQQAVRFAAGLHRRGVLDLSARRFRTTLWAGDHRCLDHLELDDVQAVICDATGGRLILESATVRLVLSAQGALTVVPRCDNAARAAHRPIPDDNLPS
jgi:hypothetical protein